jgi:hypothetical protein
VSARPNITQADRDLIEDGLAELDDRTGTGEHAEHQDEVIAS